MKDCIEPKKFGEININDSFFDSLKEDYLDFEDWFERKKANNEEAFVLYNDNKKIDGFLYYKYDGTVVEDVDPLLVGKKILKIATFKVNPHKTRLGERFIKIVLDYAVQNGYDICYLTVFPKQKRLIREFETYGFNKKGTKTSGKKTEEVYVKNLDVDYKDIYKNYPLINIHSTRKYILAIYPKYHTIMFPDSKLNTEKDVFAKDIPYTNSIHKNYICSMDVNTLSKGDIIVLYRTATRIPAEYSSVATSVCVVEEIKHQNEYENFEDFYIDASKYSLFDREDLHYWYRRGNCKIIKMLYNIALPKRITRHDLIEKIGLNRDEYWGFFEITDDKFEAILEKSKVNMNYII